MLQNKQKEKKNIFGVVIANSEHHINTDYKLLLSKKELTKWPAPLLSFQMIRSAALP
ncbi:MAG: hypothetical protein K6E54_01485 [Bacteroidaceae bacterium]|nr:hypothetical protein [Bacteroidaceae bacterium]